MTWPVALVICVFIICVTLIIDKFVNIITDSIYRKRMEGSE